MPRRVIVDSRVRVECAPQGDPLVERLRSAFTHENKKREQMQRIGVKGWWAEPATISTWKTTPDGWVSLPRGGFSRVREEAMAIGERLTVTDARTRGAGPEGEILPHQLELRGYQRESIDAMAARENCMLKAPTGSGKTAICFGLAAQLNVSTLVMVPTSGLMRQWVDRAEDELDMPESELGIIGGGKSRLRPLTICIHKTLASWARKGGIPDEVLQYFGCVVFDEVDQAAAQSCYDSVDAFPAKYRFGVSANIRRKDGKEFLVRDLFGNVAHEVSRAELEATGSVVPVDLLLAPTAFEAPWYGVQEGLVDEGEEPLVIDFGKLLSEMEADGDREAVVDACIEAELERAGPVLVLAHRRSHCMAIERRWVARGVKVGLMLGGAEYRSELEATTKGLKTGRVRVGVGTYQAVGRGVDVPALSGVVCATPIHGNATTVNQARGRAARPSKGKTSARLYLVWDRELFPGAPKRLAGSKVVGF